ncbi:MAG: glutamate--tRNA ligase [Candidatus Micrarchaeota archaeon]
MLEEIVRKHVLKNASDYGKADEKAVVGKVIAEYPKAKQEMALVMKLIREDIAKVNLMGKAQIGESLKSFAFAEKKSDDGRKFRLEGAEDGKVVTRFLPEPNGHLHIGHAKAAFLSYESAKQYGGKCILRFDDTNPEKETQEYVDAIRRDLDWLGLKFDAETFTSDKMRILHKFGGKMVILGRAYVCTCKQPVIKENRFNCRPCECRARKGGENFHMWDGMLKCNYGEGEAVLRFRGDMASENTVMRDPILFRIIKAPHYRQGGKYSVWPTYDFEVSISDSLDDVTHALRSKEYELRDELYYEILAAANLRRPVVYDFSRLNMRGTILSKRFLKPLIDGKKVSGWDDPRMPTLQGLKRRGILPDAIKEFVLRQGLSKVESEPEFESLLAINRKLLDPVAPHYFFVKDPFKLRIKNAPQNGFGSALQANGADASEHATAPLGECFITAADAHGMAKGEVFRLKGLFNVRIIKSLRTVADAEFAGKETLQGMKKIQWVPAETGSHAKCEIIEPSPLLDGKGDFNENGPLVSKGVCSKGCLDLPVGGIVQFERYGFARLDSKKPDKLVFIYSC